MELEKIMRYKVVLFTKENYFFNFKNILIKLSYEIYIKKQHDLLIDTIEKRKKKYSSNNWFNIMRLIFSKISIQDFSKIDMSNINEDNFNEYAINNINSYKIDKLQFFYLTNLCKTKIKKLYFLSVKLNIPLFNIIQIYCNICIKEIIDNKKKYIDIDNKNEFELLFNRLNGAKNFRRKISISRKSIRINNLLLTNLIKNNISKVKNKNKQTIDTEAFLNKLHESNSFDIFKKKKNSSKQKISYNNSFTRLFIGETDNESIAKRHISNFLIFKQSQLNGSASTKDLSGAYLKNLFNEIYKRNDREFITDKELKNILQKYEENQKFLDLFRKKYGANSTQNFTQKKYNTINNESNVSKIYKNSKLSFNNEVDIEKNVLKTYNNKINNYKKGKLYIGKARKKLFLKNNECPIEQSESFLIENLLKDLSESKCFPKEMKFKKLNLKKNSYMKNNFLTKTQKNIFRNDSHHSCNNDNRNRSLKNIYHNKKHNKNNIREYLFKKGSWQN